MRAEITQELMDTLTPDAKRDRYVSDVTISGFRLRVTPTGNITYQFAYRVPGSGKQRKMSIKAKSLSQARNEAFNLRAMVKAGEDPQAEKDKRGSLRKFEDEFLDWTVNPRSARRRGQGTAPRKERTAVEYRRMFLRHVPPKVRRKLVCDVTFEDLEAIMLKLSDRQPSANATMRVLKAFFSWASGRGSLLGPNQNPAHHVQLYSDVVRSYSFEGDDLNRLDKALTEAEQNTWLPIVLAVRLIMFTGCRRQEILELRWENVDLEKRQLNLVDTKTGQRRVMIGFGAIEVLERLQKHRELLPSPWVIPSPTNIQKNASITKAWQRIREAAGLPDLRIHDLRHGFGGAGAAVTPSPAHLRGLMGHKSAASGARYTNPAGEELASAADAVNERLVEGMARNVVPIRQR